MALLEVESLEVRYGAVEALRAVSFHVDEGEVVSVIGSNGAGKSSMLLALSGIVRRSSGSIRFAGADIGSWRADRIVRAGLVQVPEGRAILAPLTVHENLVLGAWTRRGDRSVARDLDRIYSLFPQIAGRRNQLAGTLSGGEQQMLALGRALLAAPRLLLLDEPSMGLAPLVVSAIFDILRTIHRDGTTILLVEQNARQALRVSSRSIVLSHGRIELEGPSESVAGNSAVVEAFLGRR